MSKANKVSNINTTEAAEATEASEVIERNGKEGVRRKGGGAENFKGIEGADRFSVGIDFVPRPAQALIWKLLNANRFVSAICHRRLGKTLFSIYWLIEGAINSGIDDYRGYYFGISQKSSKLVSWHYFKKLCNELYKANLVTYSETELQIRFWNGAIITLAGSENIESYRGIYVDRLVTDELASWDKADYAFYEVLRPALSDRNGRGLFIGTVKGLDLLFDFYQMGLSDDVDYSEWSGIKLPVSFTKEIPEKELRQLKKTMSSDAYAREMECDFYAERPEVLISAEKIVSASERILSLDEVHVNKTFEVVFGVDVGRGGDPSVVYRRQGLLSKKIYSSDVKDLMEVSDRVARLIRIHNPTAVYIDQGMGGAVIDRLRRLGFEDRVIEVSFNSPSPDPGCYNIRSCMYNRLNRWLDRGIIDKDEQLLKELSNQLLIDDANNRIRLAKKADIKKIIRCSPNDGDALALTFYEEDAIDYGKKSAQEMLDDYMYSEYGESENQEYDPLNYMDSITSISTNSFDGSSNGSSDGSFNGYDRY
jgi:hypothetical protein